MSERHDVVVVGAGVHGLCAAFALRRRGRSAATWARVVGMKVSGR